MSGKGVPEASRPWTGVVPTRVLSIGGVAERVAAVRVGGGREPPRDAHVEAARVEQLVRQVALGAGRDVAGEQAVAVPLAARGPGGGPPAHPAHGPTRR